MDTKRKLLVAGAALVTVGAGGVGGAAIASAASGDSGSASYGRVGPGGPGERGASGEGGRACGPDGRGGPGARGTAVTGAVLTKVTAAVKKKDADVTVKDVRQADDGRYFVRGTKDDKPVMLEVSKDLTTVTEHTGPPRGFRGDHGPMRRDGTRPSPSASPST